MYKKDMIMNQRTSGILLHISSLPGHNGIGDLGPDSFIFADFLEAARQSFWQILPLTPTQPISEDSPYSGSSVFAGNTLLISIERLYENNLLTTKDLSALPDFPRNKVDFPLVRKHKEYFFHRAYQRFRKGNYADIFRAFCSHHSHWLDDYALFVSLKEHYKQKPWHKWPEAIRDRDTQALAQAQEHLKDRIRKEKFLQYCFYEQWNSLKQYCNDRGIRIIGDMPIYVSHDSADVWCHPELFQLDDNKRPEAISGVPPDYFSPTGQLWGNPVYRWDVMKETGFSWWVRRFAYNLTMYDYIRIDHFRGYVAFWEVPAHEKTAVNGIWVEAPGNDLFTTLLKKFSCLPVIAEDIGTITPAVREVLNRFGFPGTRPIIFAFGKNLSTHSCAPHNISKNTVAYTGTHDCNTIKGWYRKDATREDRKRLSRYLGRRVSEATVHREFIRLAMMCAADMAIIPMQDILGLDETARMNLPATRQGNWQWRLTPDRLTPALAHELGEWTDLYGRT